jgi:hypothetical protein
LFARKPNLELEQRARRERVGCLDEDASPADVIRVVLDELIDRSALVADIQANDLHAPVFAGVLGHLYSTPSQEKLDKRCTCAKGLGHLNLLAREKANVGER